ncbi:MAG: hypothetical protein AAGM84_01680 [Pseudomonadota bacterium]
MLKPIPTKPDRPKWTDRQRIGAADLTAEQVWQDEQLQRLRRMALGWGVITGFDVEAEEGALRLGRGYGLTAAGSEVYLPETVVIEDLAKAICTRCGEGDSCAIVDKETGREGPVTAWLVLRPERAESCARPTVPEGCVHPGSAFAYSRMGVALVPEIMCTLEDSLVRPEIDCERVQSYLDAAEVPWPEQTADVLPVAEIACEDGTIIEVSTARRRKLLPLTALQDVVACCDCDATASPVEEPDTPDTDPDNGGDTGPRSPWLDPGDALIGELIGDIFGAFPDDRNLKVLTVADVFGTATDTARGFTLSVLAPRSSGASPEAKAFVASLFVATEAGLALYRAEDWTGVLAEATEGQGDRGFFSAARSSGPWFEGRSAKDLARLTVREAVAEGFGGYEELSAALGDQSGADWSGKPMGDILGQVDDLPFAAQAAAIWMFFRLDTAVPR